MKEKVTSHWVDEYFTVSYVDVRYYVDKKAEDRDKKIDIILNGII